MAGGTGVARSLAWPTGLGRPAVLVCPALGAAPLLRHDHCGRRPRDLDYGGRDRSGPASPCSQSLLVLGGSLRAPRLLGLLLLDDRHRAGWPGSVRPDRPGLRRQFRPPRRGADGSSAWGGGLLFTGGGNFDASEFEMDCGRNAPCCCGHAGSLRRRWRPDCQRNKLHSGDQEQEVLGPLQQRRVPADGPRRQTREAQARVDEGHGYARRVRKV